MTGIWRGKPYDPYNVIVYDEKRKRKMFMESVRRIGVRPWKAHMKRLEKMREEGKI